MSISGLKAIPNQIINPDEFDFSVNDLNRAIERHFIYFREFYTNETIGTRSIKRNLQQLGVIFTGSRNRVSKRFIPIVKNYLEARTVTSNGKRAYIIISIYINEKQETSPSIIMFFEAPTNREKLYVFYDKYPNPGEEVKLIGIRSHAIARYKERKANLSSHDVVKEIYRIIRSDEFQKACIPYRAVSLRDKSKENMIYRTGTEEIRVTISVIFRETPNGNIDNGLIVIVHTYINLENNK